MSELATGRELDALIAERVLGIAPELLHVNPAGEYRDTAIGRMFVAEVPRYSTEIGAAWDVVEHLRAAGWVLQLDNNHGWACKFGRPGAMASVFDIPTAPLAICRAALAALEDAP